MKKWEAASIEALNVDATAQGGSNKTNEDMTWKDQYNNTWSSYASGDTHDQIDGDVTIGGQKPRN